MHFTNGDITSNYACKIPAFVAAAIDAWKKEKEKSQKQENQCVRRPGIEPVRYGLSTVGSNTTSRPLREFITTWEMPACYIANYTI